MYIHSFNHIPEIGDYIFSQFETEIKNLGFISIALSGGNTPNALFEYWVKQYSDRADVWNAIYFYWVDERAVPPSDSESNYGTARLLFFAALSIPESHIFRMKGEEKAHIEAQRYEELLTHQLQKKNAIPQFDFVFLGLGEDGHTASIFPGQEDILTQTSQLCKESFNPYTKQERITLTSTTINNARRVIFIILGKQKKEIFEQVFSTDKTDKKYPAQWIEPRYSEIEILTNIK
ncbi:MAG: 6-phosphogluconolactonase [Bacteroidales bacterium]|jgi:6-phosphogluconolactonase|nr:6-phosphogluconolactonase [Bacteroidales bacterium]